ncbi:MAG: MBL fold metallo-hydrolase [Armatimonadota bacterium]
MAITQRHVVGALQTNCYLIGADGSADAAVIDPGAEADMLLQETADMDRRVTAVVLTHGHVDHIKGVSEIVEATGAEVYIHGADSDILRSPDPFWSSMVGGCEGSEATGKIADGDLLEVAGLQLTVMHTPGHSPGSVCLMMDGSCFTGDTLFAGSIGRTDLPGSDPQAMERSLNRLMEQIPDDVEILPGHGPTSTMAEERSSNPFLTAMTQ